MIDLSKYATRFLRHTGFYFCFQIPRQLPDCQEVECEVRWKRVIVTIKDIVRNGVRFARDIEETLGEK